VSSGGRTNRAALVWLTALMTLITSLPHFDCRCPNGRVKRFCLGLTCRTCCCAGACCPAAQAGRRLSVSTPSSSPGGSCPRCHKSQAAEGKFAADEPAVGRTGCVRTLIESALVATGEGRTDTDPVPVAEFLPSQPALASLATASGLRRSTYQPGDSPPPTDLVILLRHLLI
jgi:hypothetical protein